MKGFECHITTQVGYADRVNAILPPGSAAREDRTHHPRREVLMPRYFIYDRYLRLIGTDFATSADAALDGADKLGQLLHAHGPFAVEPAPEGAKPTPPLTYKEREDAPLSH